MPTCGWICSFSQEAGSRTASLKRSNQVKGLRHSRSVSWLFSETLQYPWVNSAIAISWQPFLKIFFFALMEKHFSIHAMSQSTADIFMTLPYSRECSFWLWLTHCSFPTLKQHSCSISHCEIDVSDMNPFLLSELILNACRLYDIIQSHISYTAFMTCACWDVANQSVTFSAKSRPRSPRILFKMEVLIWNMLRKY